MKYFNNKPIRLIELFAGIGSQAKALKNIGANFEHWRVCEFDNHAINSYNAVGVVVKEPTELQKEVGNQAIEKGLVKPYDIINYTYSNARLDEIKNGKIHTKNSMDNQIANTLTTNAENMAVCVPGEINVVGNYSPSGHEASRIVHPDGISPTIKENHGTVTATIEPSLRIRKLTPKECWRLMGFDDTDVDNASKVCSNSQLYKQAGNSIVVNVLMAIFKELFVPKRTQSEWLDELLGGV